MAGRPRRQALIIELEKRTREWAQTHDEEQAGIYDHLDYAESWIASGKTLTKLADDIGESVGFELSRDMLKRYLSEGRKDEANKRLAEARNDGAFGLVDQAMQLVDDANTSDKEKLTKAKMQAETRLWAAERYNKRDLGKAADVQINLNMNTLHLDALRVRELEREQQKAVPALDPSRARLIGVEMTQPAEDVIEAVILPNEGES